MSVLQVSLCVCLTLASGLPAAKRLSLSHSHDSDDVLAGSDFLSVFMPRMRESDRSFEPHQYALNSVGHLTSPYQRISDKYSRYKTTKYDYNTLEVAPTVDTETKTTTLFTEPTTVEDVPTTSDYLYEKSADRSANEIQQPTDPPSEEGTTKIESTSEQVATEKVEEKVISVRVSSSVARHSFRTIETSTAKSVSRVRANQEDENLVSTLVTQEQPTITAVQRSAFGVEEAPLPDSREPDKHERKDETNYEKQEEIEGKVQEVSVYGNDQQRLPKGKLPVFEIHFHNPPAALISNYGAKPEIQRNEESHPFRRKEFRQLSQPISYQSRISSPTSDSSVNFYREHPRNNYPAVAETVNQPVLSQPYPPAAYRSDKTPEGESPNESSYKEIAPPNEEHREQTYGEPEKVYGQPEVNYEVDEAVSVITNGKAHGVQVPTPPPMQSPAGQEDPSGQNKFGYVVEGRNFRKYRVEERTADGFIVGEYGVVSHDDGSLRGVRYTADSTINPRLIYDTLVKFLSLK